MGSTLKHEIRETLCLEDKDIDEQALIYLRKNGTVSVPKLYDALKIRFPLLTKVEVTNLVGRLVERGQADVEDLPTAANSVWEYLRFWERTLWFYASVAASLATMLVIYGLPSEFPLVVLRWVVGSVFVLLIPGYVTVKAFFPMGRNLDGIERFVLSVGLSLVLVPLVGLLLNYTPWGIRLAPIMISLTTFTIVVSLVALERQFRLSTNGGGMRRIQA